jgi:CBS domain-containing protein
MAVVAERMSRDLLTVEPSAALGEAAGEMHGRGVGTVVDGGALVGILSLRDLMRVVLEDSAPRGV